MIGRVKKSNDQQKLTKWSSGVRLGEIYILPTVPKVRCGSGKAVTEKMSLACIILQQELYGVDRNI